MVDRIAGNDSELDIITNEHEHPNETGEHHKKREMTYNKKRVRREKKCRKGDTKHQTCVKAI